MAEELDNQHLAVHRGAVEGVLLSPLRYPGAKRWLADYIGHTIRLNALRPKVFVEPFAGGAGVSLQLLREGLVDMIALGEKDPLVASFWKVVFDDPTWLIDQIRNEEVTLQKWCQVRNWHPRSDRNRALKCLYLNRTSFSGILAETAGPIGGRKQESRYKIGCRFYAETIVDRIERAHSMRNSVLFVQQSDWRQTIKRVEEMSYLPGEVFYYLDPPFYAKAERLYRFHFRPPGHRRLRDFLIGLEQPWLLSYDPAQQIVDLYSGNGVGPRRVTQLYSISAGRSPKQAQELIISNLQRIPDACGAR